MDVLCKGSVHLTHGFSVDNDDGFLPWAASVIVFRVQDLLFKKDSNKLIMSHKRATWQVSILCHLGKIEEIRDIWLKEDLINGYHKICIELWERLENISKLIQFKIRKKVWRIGINCLMRSWASHYWKHSGT